MNNATQQHSPTALRDISGYEYFSAGELGAAHALAHQMLDQGDYATGHAQLGRFLSGRSGHGSQWVHVQWHMMVFEIAVGDHASARTRFFDRVLPAALYTSDALTDAPAAMWRLALSSAAPLPWQAVHQTAVAHLHTSTDPYVVLHHLLAIAGARDVATLDQWLASFEPQDSRGNTLRAMGFGLRCFANADYDLAASAFTSALPRLSAVGGSRAQNELFHQLYRVAISRAADSNRTTTVH